MYLLCMIKARIRWCTCRVENILTLGKLLSLWFCFLLHSILFLISQTSYRTYKIISRYELARPIMGTIFLVYLLCMMKVRIGWRTRSLWIMLSASEASHSLGCSMSNRAIYMVVSVRTYKMQAVISPNSSFAHRL